jgi:hypothetical protein
MKRPRKWLKRIRRGIIWVIGNYITYGSLAGLTVYGIGASTYSGAEFGTNMTTGMNIAFSLWREPKYILATHCTWLDGE